MFYGANHRSPISRLPWLPMYTCVCRLSQRSASSSIDDSDDDRARRQPMERNIYSEAGDSSSDESSNDSFTASEFEADEPKVC